MFSESPDSYLDDFGVPCSKGSVIFSGILDVPDNTFDVGGMSIHSREYSLAFRTGDVSFAMGDSVTVDGVGFVVRSPPVQIDDGRFSTAKLSKP